MDLSETILRLSQLAQLHHTIDRADEFNQIGAYDVAYLEAIDELGNPKAGDLSRLLKQTTPNTNYHITKLVKKGYVEQNRDEKDGRIRYVRLTDKGRKEILEDSKDRWERISQSLNKKFSPMELRTYEAITDEIIKELSAEAQAKSQRALRKNSREDN